MNNRPILSLALLIAMLTLLAACGDSSSVETADSRDAQASLQSSSEPSSPGIASETNPSDPTEPSVSEATTSTQATDAGGSPMADRLVAYFVGGGDGFAEAEARCAADRLVAELRSDRLDLMVTNLETIDEIEDGEQFSDDELLTISRSLASCLDFSEQVDELRDNAVDEAMLECVTTAIGIDEVEALVLFEALGENGDQIYSPLVVEGFRSCPELTRSALEQSVLDQFLSEDQAAIAACLPTITNDEMRGFAERNDLFGLVSFVESRCA